MRTKKCILAKMFTIGLNMVFSLQTWVENTVYGVETYWFSGKKKFWSQRPANKMNVKDMKGSITVDLLGKGATVNNASYCQHLRKY